MYNNSSWRVKFLALSWLLTHATSKVDFSLFAGKLWLFYRQSAQNFDIADFPGWSLTFFNFPARILTFYHGYFMKFACFFLFIFFLCFTFLRKIFYFLASHISPPPNFFVTMKPHIFVIKDDSNALDVYSMFNEHHTFIIILQVGIHWLQLFLCHTDFCFAEVAKIAKSQTSF